MEVRIRHARESRDDASRALAPARGSRRSTGDRAAPRASAAAPCPTTSEVPPPLLDPSDSGDVRAHVRPEPERSPTAHEGPPIAILGGCGKTGGRVDALLRARGHATRPLSRSTTPTFDWNDPAGWAAALRGARAAYVTYQPDLAVPGADEAIDELCRVAKREGLNRLVLLSGRGEDAARRSEAVLQTGPLPWTVVRASWFDQNFSESFLLEPIRSGEVALPVGEVREPFVDANDIAEVAAAALTEEGHAGRVYEVTGPRALSFADAVAEIARAVDRPLRYVEVPLGAFADGLRAAGVPSETIDLMCLLFTQVLDGRNEPVTRGVRAALHRPPRDFSEYVRATAASGVWAA